MFSLSKPTRPQIDRFIASARETDFTYSSVGETKNDAQPPTYTIDHNHIVIGNGESEFVKAKQAIRDWKMFDMPWVEICWPDTPVEEDQTVAILIRHFGFYSLNAARIVYTIDKWDWFGFAYGTLPGHPFVGEESFAVELADDDDVWFVIRAFSKPATLLTRLGAPVARVVQTVMTNRFVNALRQSQDR